MEIVICPNCKGHGQEDEGFHDGPSHRTCTRCGGNGLLKKTITFERYHLTSAPLTDAAEPTEAANFLKRFRAWLSVMPMPNQNELPHDHN